MTWVGAGACFVGWLWLGWLAKSRSASLSRWLGGLGRGVRVFLGSGGLVAGLLLLAGGMYGIALMGGADKAGIKLWAWPLIFVVGGLFVLVQVVGAFALASLILVRETSVKANSSGTPEINP